MVDAPQHSIPHGVGTKDPWDVTSHVGRAIPRGTTYTGLSYTGLSYMSSWPLSEGPSVLQVGRQQTRTAPSAAQVTSQTHRALPYLCPQGPSRPRWLCHEGAAPLRSWRCPITHRPSPSQRRFPGCHLLRGISPALHLALPPLRENPFCLSKDHTRFPLCVCRARCLNKPMPWNRALMPFPPAGC